MTLAMPMTALEAVTKATDPYGIDGSQNAHMRPPADEVLRRLDTLGFVVVRKESAKGYLTGSDCGDVAIAAAEGGIGYWSVIDRYEFKRWSPDYLNESYIKGEAPAANIDVPDDFVFYTITYENPESDDPPELSTPITPELLRRGVRLFLDGVEGNFVGRQFSDMEDLAAMDSDEADCVVQLGVFGKLVFG